MNIHREILKDIFEAQPEHITHLVSCFTSKYRDHQNTEVAMLAKMQPTDVLSALYILDHIERLVNS